MLPGESLESLSSHVLGDVDGDSATAIYGCEMWNVGKNGAGQAVILSWQHLKHHWILHDKTHGEGGVGFSFGGSEMDGQHLEESKLGWRDHAKWFGMNLVHK
jgi:hypothetical protein